MTRTVASWSCLDAAERRARCRALGALARVFCGPRAAELLARLRAAETDPTHLPACDDALAALPTLPLRRCLATFAETLPRQSGR